MLKPTTPVFVRADGSILWHGAAYLALGKRPGDLVLVPRSGPDDLNFPPVEATRRAPSQLTHSV